MLPCAWCIPRAMSRCRSRISWQSSHISKGAFYHYFDSKQALLEALIERMARQVIQLLVPIVQDEHLPAPEKLHRLFDAASRWKTDRKDVMLTLVNVWYADENAILRLKAQAAVLPLIAPLLTNHRLPGCQGGRLSHRISRADQPDHFFTAAKLWRYPDQADPSTRT